MKAIFYRELLLLRTQIADILISWLFFLGYIIIVIFSLDNNLNLSSKIGPALIWTAYLFTILLNIDRIFKNDQLDGSLDNIFIGQSFSFYILFILTKITAHMINYVIPLLLLEPILGFMLHMQFQYILWTNISLFLAGPSLLLIGAAVAAITCTLQRSALLSTLLLLPLAIPIIIFALKLITDCQNRLYILSLLFLITLIFLIICPIIAALALKYLITENEI